MLGKYLLRTQNQVIQQLCCRLCLRGCSLDHKILERLAGDIMRRGAYKLLAASVNHQKMAILDAGIEMDFIIAKLLLQGLDYLIGLRG